MTRRAISVMVSAPTLAALSWWLGYPTIAIIAAAFAVLVPVAALFVIRPPTSGIKRRVNPTRVTRGEAAQVHLWKRNLSPLPSVPLDATDRIGHLTVELSIPAVRPGGRAEAVYRFVTTRRGHLEVGPVVLSRRDPWGLFHRVRETGDVDEISVYPRVLQVPPPDIVHRLSRDAGAAEVTAGTDRFHTLREYVVGDELRKVHWPSSARTGTLMVKQMVDSPRPRLLLFCDCAEEAYSDPEFFEQAVEATASLANAISAAGVDLVVTAGRNQFTIEINRAADLDAMLEALVALQPEARPAPISALRASLVATRATGIVGVTGTTGNFTSMLAGLRSVVTQSEAYRIGATQSALFTQRNQQIHDLSSIDDLALRLPPAATSAAP